MYSNNSRILFGSPLNSKDGNTAAAAYGVKSVPASFLIGPDGKILAKDLRGENLHKQLATIFASK